MSAMTEALEIDLYELTMACAYLAEGRAAARATFSLFPRHLPARAGYLVAAGLDDALTYLETLRFQARDLEALDGLGLFPRAFLEHLSAFRFSGSVRAVPEGRVVLAQEPLLEVDGTLLEAQLIETGLLNRMTYQTVLATRAARLVEAAGGRTVAEFGLRSAPGAEAGLRLARAARIGGLASTSNVAGALRYGLPAGGTMAHSYVLAHQDELEAFTAFARRFGSRTVLLVDTYDVAEGIRTAVGVAQRLAAEGTTIAGVRLDSGNLDALSRFARRLLDQAGLGEVGVFATGGLDELAISRLVAAGAPVAGFGVGAALAVAAEAPAVEAAYKLVELDGRPVRKVSPGKITWAGAKQVWRRREGDVLSLASEPGPAGAEALLETVMENGVRCPVAIGPGGACDVEAATRRRESDIEWLPEVARRILDPRPPSAMPSAALLELTESLARRGR